MKKQMLVAISVFASAAVVTVGTFFTVCCFTHEFTSPIPGDISNVQVTQVTSERYTQEEINSAIEVAKQYFQENFPGCRLTEISYAEERWQQVYQFYAQQYDADEVIVLTSSFQTGPYPDISMNKNCTYTQWQWILARNHGGEWKHVGHGY